MLFFQGNIEIFHFGEWGSICDDEFDDSEARVICKQLGFPGSKRSTSCSGDNLILKYKKYY
jgi:lysyl oxidase-like protein 2/3/4